MPIVEFRVAATEFTLGRALSAAGATAVELERLVPVADGYVPYAWIRADDFTGFERELIASDHVASVTDLDEHDGSRLYRITWASVPNSLTAVLARVDAVILEARATEKRWTFRVRFADADAAGEFYRECERLSIAIDVTRAIPTAADDPSANPFGLTDRQLEALTFAVAEGYFTVPRQCTLSDVAAELGVSEQAASALVRRAADRVLREALRTVPERAPPGEDI